MVSKQKIPAVPFFSPNLSLFDKCVTVPQGSKVVHFIRHGKAAHNEAFDIEGTNSYYDEKYFDSRLTQLGVSQAQALERKLSSSPIPMEVVIVSPLSRTLQTAFHLFPKGIHNTPPLVAIETCRERFGVYPCDRRRQRSIISKEFPRVDFSEISEDDRLWTTERETQDQLESRGRDFVLKTLMQRKEKFIVVVSHASFLVTLFNSVLDCPREYQGTFENCELRSMVLDFRSFQRN